MLTTLQYAGRNRSLSRSLCLVKDEAVSGTFPTGRQVSTFSNLMRDTLMTSIRKAWWAALASTVLVVGCGGEETTPSAPVNSSPVLAPAPTPGGPEMKNEPKASPAPEKKDEAPKADMPKVDAPKVDAPKTDIPKASVPEADASKLSGDELAEIKKLPADEQEAAIKQLTCPVSGEHLGEMGVPLKISAEGKSFYICCKSCKEKAQSDAKAILAKLAK